MPGFGSGKWAARFGGTFAAISAWSGEIAAALIEWFGEAVKRPDCRGISPCSSPAEGEFGGYGMCKFFTRSAFTHSHIWAEMPHVGVAPETSAHLARP